MGMFDYVNVEMDCPNCGQFLKGFQSKDDYCWMKTIDPEHVNRFYIDCHNCHYWIEFSRDPEPDLYEVRGKPYTRKEVEDMGFELTQCRAL